MAASEDVAKEKVVISIGGSVMVPGEDDLDYIKELSQLLIKLGAQFKLYVVVGGGKIARYYIRIARELDVEEDELDRLGIAVTRLNATLLIKALGEEAYRFPVTTTDEAAYAAKFGNIVVMGGTAPGQTTDAVAAELASSIKAVRLINATSVDGVYTADPNVDPEAKKIPKMEYTQLWGMVKRIISWNFCIILKPWSCSYLHSSADGLLHGYSRND